MAADRIALVVAPGVTLRGPGAGEDVIAAYERAFLWLEGVVDAGGDESGVRWHGVRRSVMRGVDVSGSGWLGVSLWSSHHNQLVDLRVAHNDTGLFLTGSSHNTIHRVTASNNTDVGVHLLNGCEANTLGTVTSFAATEGVRIEGSVDNTLAAVTVANTGGYTGLADGGVHLFAGSDHTLVMSAAVANGSGSGFFLELSNRNTFVDVAAADGGITGGKTAAFRLDDSSHNRFTGVLKAGHKATTKACSASGGDEPGLLPGAAGCANAGDSDATITNDVTTADTFVGKALEDAVNVGGTGLLPASCVSDWAGFENRSRGWGLDGGAFPSVDHIGPCVTGPCRIWDWSLSASDTVLADVNPGLPGGDDVVQHNWSAGSAAECEAMGGDWTGDLCTSVLLRGAVEVLADGVGNDNGLCESRERCLVTPNVGAYQGHEDAQIVGTIGQGAQLSDIVLLRHPVNGM